jgi:hypothetical protein
LAGFLFGDKLFSIHLYNVSSFSGSMWFVTFFRLMVFPVVLWGLVRRLQRFLILVGWNILVVSVYIGFFLILVGLINGFNIII